jgi:hypothetical protein
VKEGKGANNNKVYQEGANESYQQKNKRYKIDQMGGEGDTQERQESQQSNQAGKPTNMGKTMSQSIMQAESWGKEEGDICEKETSQL